MSPARISKDVHRQWEAPTDPRKLGAQCDRCPLKDQTPVFGDGPREARLAFVGEAPGRDEVSLGIPFVGTSGELLVRWLEKLKLSRQEAWITNAVMCFPEGGDMKAFLQRERKRLGGNFVSPVECCRPRLLRELRVPTCGSCGKWQRGPDAIICTCPAPKWRVWKDKDGLREMPEVTVALGNYALAATIGVEGITAHRGYVEDVGARRDRLTGTGGGRT